MALAMDAEQMLAALPRTRPAEQIAEAARREAVRDRDDWTPEERLSDNGVSPLHHPSVHYHVHVFHKDDGWYFRCPEHQNRRGMGPFVNWDMAMVIVDLHLRNFNHY